MKQYRETPFSGGGDGRNIKRTGENWKKYVSKDIVTYMYVYIWMEKKLLSLLRLQFYHTLFSIEASSLAISMLACFVTCVLDRSHLGDIVNSRCHCSLKDVKASSILLSSCKDASWSSPSSWSSLDSLQWFCQYARSNKAFSWRSATYKFNIQIQDMRISYKLTQRYTCPKQDFSLHIIKNTVNSAHFISRGLDRKKPDFHRIA